MRTAMMESRANETCHTLNPFVVKVASKQARKGYTFTWENIMNTRTNSTHHYFLIHTFKVPKQCNYKELYTGR